MLCDKGSLCVNEAPAEMEEQFEITRLCPTSPVSEARRRATALHRAVLRLTVMSAVAGNHNTAGAEAAWEPEARGPQPITQAHKSCRTLVAF